MVLRGSTRLIYIIFIRWIPVCSCSLCFLWSSTRCCTWTNPFHSVQYYYKIVSRSAFFHLRNIAKIRKLLTQLDAEKLVWHLLLPGWPTVYIIIRISKQFSEKPVLASLHRLPINSRIVFKIPLLTYKIIRANSALWTLESYKVDTPLVFHFCDS